MDLDEWEVVSDDGFLEINDDGGHKIYSRKYICDSNNNSVFQNYFSCSAPNPTQFVDSTIVSGQSGAQTIPYSITNPTQFVDSTIMSGQSRAQTIPYSIVIPERIGAHEGVMYADCFHDSNPVPKQIIPIQIRLDPKIDDEEVTKEVITSTQEVPFEINMLPSTISENIKSPVARNLETEQDHVLSQVFFKKMNMETDMKVESPKSNNIKNFVAQIDAAAADQFQYEEKENKKVEMEDNRGGLKVLNWSLNGIGAICSFGVAAAATVCIIFIGNRQKHKQNQMLRFQIFSDDKVSGDFIDRALTSRQRSTYTSVLFYASWCPFSRRVHSIFEAISSMYPQIEHLAVEQSSATPSLFSRYGIHSVPAVLMFNQSSRMWFRGSKDLDSLSEFYKRTTGLEPIQFVNINQCCVLRKNARSAIESKLFLPLNEMLVQEPYLSFAVAFLCLRVIWIVAQRLAYRVKTFWTRHRPNPNLDIFGETGQILRRIVHEIDMKRLWTKLRQCKIRNLHQGTRSARVWASSLASVSLGESSTSR